MARDKQNPIIQRLITNLVETFQQSTDPDLRRETAAQLEKIIYSQSWLIELPGVPRMLGVLANFRTGGKLGHTSSGSSDTASSAADPGLIDTASSASDSRPADVTTWAADTSSGSSDAVSPVADPRPCLPDQGQTEEQDNLQYASVHFSEKQADAVYSNIRAAQPSRQEQEVTEYSPLRFIRDSTAPRFQSQYTEENPAALYSTINKT
ncbi:hypothetical protein Q8A73_002946 [Channa argus]|nr:hypothetical protein Q8A73_002946 [Channa argus]